MSPDLPDRSVTDRDAPASEPLVLLRTILECHRGHVHVFDAALVGKPCPACHPPAPPTADARYQAMMRTLRDDCPEFPWFELDSIVGERLSLAETAGSVELLTQAHDSFVELVGLADRPPGSSALLPHVRRIALRERDALRAALPAPTPKELE